MYQNRIYQVTGVSDEQWEIIRRAANSAEEYVLDEYGEFKECTADIRIRNEYNSLDSEEENIMEGITEDEFVEMALEYIEALY